VTWPQSLLNWVVYSTLPKEALCTVIGMYTTSIKQKAKRVRELRVIRQGACELASISVRLWQNVSMLDGAAQNLLCN
jgi:hypothetical protein